MEAWPPFFSLTHWLMISQTKVSFLNLPPHWSKQRTRGFRFPTCFIFYLLHKQWPFGDFSCYGCWHLRRCNADMEAAAASIALANPPHLPVLPLQAAAAHLRTDTHGFPSSWDHPNPCSHSDPKLSAHQAEPLQQPDHHAVQLPQVRATSAEPFLLDGLTKLWVIYTFYSD